MKVYSKKKIEEMIRKNNHFMNEDSQNSFVEPSSDSSTSLSGDLSKSIESNPNDDTFIFNANSYDGDSSNNTITLDVNGSNPTKIAQNFQNMSRRPEMKNLMRNTNVNVKARIGESLEKLRESSVAFTKREIKNLRK